MRWNKHEGVYIYALCTQNFQKCFYTKIYLSRGKLYRCYVSYSTYNFPSLFCSSSFDTVFSNILFSFFDFVRRRQETQGDATDEWSTNTWRNTKDKNLNTWCFFQRAQKEAIANYFTNSIILIVSIRKSWFYAKPYTLLIKKNVKSKFVYVNKNISEKHCAYHYWWW